MSRYIFLLVLGTAVVSACYGLSTLKAQDALLRLRRQVDSHGHAHEGESTATISVCQVTEHILAHEFTELAEELVLIGPDSMLCSIEDEHHSGNETEAAHVGHGKEIPSPLNLTCDNTYIFVEQLLLRLNLTSDCCLENGTVCEEPPASSVATTTGVAEAYGYGFLMVLLVSACSLLGLPFVPLLKKGSKFGQLYKYFNSLMIALGASALFCDAILHLIPEAFGLHGHSAEEEVHSEEGEDQTFIWKGCVVIVGTYLFFLFETILHTWNPHNHSHELDSLHKKEGDDGKNQLTDSSTSANGAQTKSPFNARYSNMEEEGDGAANQDNSEISTLVPEVGGQKENRTSEVIASYCVEPTMPHGHCKDTSSSSPAGILHPTVSNGSLASNDVSPTSQNFCLQLCYYIRNIKPLAWLIIFGDAIHNFADGLALGAAIAQSLSLGISTMIALIFHEIPHELGDFVILVSTGMKWYTALMFNFFSAVTAIVGFFVGVAISTNSEAANGWILAIAAGIFLYIALVDLLPELIHSKEKGNARWCLFLMANIGLVISFVALLLLAIYEEQLNSLISF